MLSSMGAALLVMGTLVVVSLIGMAAYFALKHIRASNESLREVTQLTAQRVARLRRIAVSCTDGGLADLAIQIADDLRFGDTALALALDEEIDNAIGEAEGAVRASNASAAEEALGRILHLSRHRAAEEICVRRGSF